MKSTIKVLQGPRLKVLVGAVVISLAISACGGASGTSGTSESEPLTKNAALTRPACNSTLPCKVGEIGTGGGTIFYHSSTGFPCGVMGTSTCNFLEYAPANWVTLGGSASDCTSPNASTDPVCSLSKTTTSPASSLFRTGLGAGFMNTNAYRLQTATGVAAPISPAANAARNYTGSNIRNTYYLQDWYIPSLAEATELCKYANGNPVTSTTCSAGTLKLGFSANAYWTSDAPASATDANGRVLNFGTGSSTTLMRSQASHVRPIRAFAGVVNPASVVTTTSTTTTMLPATTTTLTCAQGGNCAIGAIGPGGGKVFFVKATGFACGETLTRTCRYLEAAADGSGPAAGKWPSGVIATATDIGTGAKNTAAMVSLGGTSNTAAAVRAYKGGGRSDWYIGSKDEMNEFCKSVRIGTNVIAPGNPMETCAPGMVRSGIAPNTRFISSSTNEVTTMWALDLRTSPVWTTPLRTFTYQVRAIRAF